MKTIQAAAAKVDITPYLVTKTYLAGFAPNRLATGVAEPLCARILYLEDENGPLVWIATDLIGFLYGDIDDLRAKLPEIAPERLFACATHTHSGPDTMGLWGPSVGPVPVKSGRDPEYIKWLLEQIATGVRRAQARKQPAVIGFGEDLSEKSEWVVNIRQKGYNDQALTVMRVDGLAGEPIACLVNFACHPETLWEKNTDISPDFVHHLLRTVEEASGAVGIYISGALGGMVTSSLPDETPLAERRVFYRKMGKALGKIAVATWKSISPEAVEKITHRYHRGLFPFDNKVLFFMKNLGILNREMTDDRIFTRIDYWKIGPAEFVSLPGEALPAVGFKVKRLMHGKPNFLFCLGNDELGYLLDEQLWPDPKYHYEKTVSVGPAAVEQFYRLIAELVADQ